MINLPFAKPVRQKTNNPEQVREEWAWRLRYCKNKGIPPGQLWAWNESYTAYKEGKEGKDK